MPYSLLWLPDVLREAGLEVIECPGWQNRGHGDVRKIVGVLCHHTAGPLKGDMPSLDILINGRPDLPGPLCQLGLSRSGKYYVIAAGEGWHAGAGNWQGITDGNGRFIGIEAENTGLPNDPWPDVQMDAYRRGCAAILRHIGSEVIMAVGHKEYALPKGRKSDPSFDMTEFRAQIMEERSDMEPASIRYKNPGAMWGRTGQRPSADMIVPTNAPIPKKWGSTKTAYLNDGLGQNNNIAIFDTWVQGICAQQDLWRSSDKYRNKRFADAIHIWAGGNNVPEYIAFVKKRVPGITEDTIMNEAFWKGPMGIPFLKAQAWHEAGKPYPAPEEDWVEAQKRVFAPAIKTEATAVVIAAGSAGAAVASAGWNWPEIALTVFIVVGLAVAVVALIRKIRSS